MSLFVQFEITTEQNKYKEREYESIDNNKTPIFSTLSLSSNCSNFSVKPN